MSFAKNERVKDPFYGELSAEEAELLRVPHGTTATAVTKLREILRISRLICTSVAVVSAVVIAMTVAIAIIF